MANFDDRPISVYDNLSTPTNNTPKTKTNGATTSSTPYADITFKFNNENNNAQNQQQRHQHQSHQTHLLPTNNNNHSLNQTSNQFLPTAITMTSNPNNYTYATPFKPTTATIAPHIQTPTQSSSAQSPTATYNTNTTPLTIASPTLRPLSQHSQTDLNEATVQSIAAVKAALHDAKSKFFGLNGYAANDNNQQPQQQQLNESPNQQKQKPENLYNNNLTTTTPTQHYKPKVQILTPPPKPTPKYQNIPENSAIFRNLTPPERPPKPMHYQSSTPNVEPITSPAQSSSTSSSSSPNSRLIMPTMHNTEHHTSPLMSAPEEPSSSRNVSPARSLPYKQIPLNDIDIASPSQAVYMSTTVPQNIKGSKIAGRHTPTRTSLRHSRMLVINNKNYQPVQHPNPMNFKQPNLARWMLILQILIGSLLVCLAIWIFLLAPNTAIQDNPYWSGLVLLLAGIIGLILIRYRRIQRDKVRENCFLFLRADSFILSMSAALLCCVAMIFAAIHFARLMANDTICISSNILQEHASCLCTFNASPAMLETLQPKNTTLEEDNINWLNIKGEKINEKKIDIDDRSYKMEYRDLSCQEVTCEWTTLLGISMALNGLGLLVSFIFIVLLACHRYNSKRIYTSVQTSTF